MKNDYDKAGSNIEKTIDITIAAAIGAIVQALPVMSWQQRCRHVNQKFSVTGNVREGLATRKTCHLWFLSQIVWKQLVVSAEGTEEFEICPGLMWSRVL